jgi:hypothetical protein
MIFRNSSLEPMPKNSTLENGSKCIRGGYTCLHPPCMINYQAFLDFFFFYLTTFIPTYRDDNHGVNAFEKYGLQIKNLGRSLQAKI